MKILVTGGAGYIGSNVVKQLLIETEYSITILDNLSTGSRKNLGILKKIRNYDFIELDLKKFSEVDNFLKNNSFEIIFHFAASIVVSESMVNPLKYYMNNTVNTTNLISCAIKNNIKKFIFSSTAAVYGEPNDIPKYGVDELFPTNPINPYGRSKLMSEKVLIDIEKTNKDFRFVIFRYFNVAGADIFYKDEKLIPRIGQITKQSTHLIKVVSEAALGIRKKISIFGNNYNTLDGTCVRDYIHIDDLSSAHLAAIDYLKDVNNSSEIFNIGYGKGFSVKDVIRSMKYISKNDFEIDNGKRREGDPSILIADSRKLKSRMKWKPKYDNLDFICKSAYFWEKNK